MIHLNRTLSAAPNSPVSSSFHLPSLLAGMLLLSFLGSPLWAGQPGGAEVQVIQLDGEVPGREFEGIGGLSAGAASRLLPDYPKRQRSQILDFLFKPNFGASLQHLKVEMGGDVNSTWGSEPSHAISREEFEHPKREFFERGYEWFLMKEAKKRNPAIFLESLQWGAPGWIGGGEFFSQDNADFIASFIKGAREYHGLTIDYQGIRNEMGYKVPWIKKLRATLDRQGLKSVKLVAADDPGDVEWKIVKDMLADAELREAVYAAGVHYVPYTTTEAAKSIGKPLWANEEARYGQPWGRAKNFARLYNRNYAMGRMTKTIICTPITSLFENLVPFNVEIWNSPGLMTANTPWSGHYVVPPALWVTAHTTQFARPGWRYLDSGCGLLTNAGSFVTLKAPGKTGDYSIIVETMSNIPFDQANANVNAKDEDTPVPPTRMKFNVKNLSQGKVRVWRSNRTAQFEQLPDITPKDGSFELTLEGNCVYSLTTTKGQRKGSYKIPPDAPFPFPFADDFEDYSPGKMAKYFSDQEGTFTVVKRADGRGKSLRQIVPQKGIRWFVVVDSPWTIVGDNQWKDYEISTDVLVPEKSFATVYGRIDAAMSRTLPGGYGLKLDSTGAWQLLDTTTVLKSGKITMTGSWQNLKLQFAGDQITAVINGNTVCQVLDDFHPVGAVALATSYSLVEFDNVAVRRLDGAKPGALTNLAKGAKTTSSSQVNDEKNAAKATDGNHFTGWTPQAGKLTNEWLEVDFGRDETFNTVLLEQRVASFGYSGGIKEYKIQHWDGSDWKDCTAIKTPAIRQSDEFPAVTARKVRLLVASCANQTGVYEFKVYRNPGR